MSQWVKTGDDGVYAFTNLPMYEDYEVSVTKNDDILNGVSTRDLVAIQKHLLGREPFGSAYDYIARRYQQLRKCDDKRCGGIEKSDIGCRARLYNLE